MIEDDSLSPEVVARLLDEARRDLSRRWTSQPAGPMVVHSIRARARRTILRDESLGVAAVCRVDFEEHGKRKTYWARLEGDELEFYLYPDRLADQLVIGAFYHLMTSSSADCVEAEDGTEAGS